MLARKQCRRRGDSLLASKHGTGILPSHAKLIEPALRHRRTIMVSKAPAAPREDWTYEELQDEAEALRARLNRFRTSLGRFLVKKQELIDLMLVAAVAQEPLLLVG